MHGDPEDRPGVDGAAAADEAAKRAPVLRPAARHVAGAERDARPRGRLDEARQVGRVVGEVAVDRGHELGAGAERVLEAGDVGGPEPLLALAVEDVEEAELRGEPVGELSGPVGRRVVDHEDASVEVVLGQDRAERAHHGLEVLALVVRGQADDEAHARIIAAVPAKLPTNTELAERFELLADMLELDGADAFRLAAYRRAAARIRESAVPVAQLAVDGKATRLSGIGGTIEGKIVEVVETGDMSALAKLRAKLPPGLVDVMHVPGLGPKTARKLWAELGVEDLDGLRAAAEQQKLRDLPGLGAKTEEKVLKSLAAPPKVAAATGRTLLGKALPAVRRAVEEIEASGLADRVSEAGSVRRRAETTKDIDLIATATDPAALTSFFSEREWVAEVVARGRNEGDRRLARGLPLRPAGRPAGELRQPPPALHRLEGPQRRPARGRGAPGALRQRVRDRRRRGRRHLHGAGRGTGLRSASAMPGSRPSCARTGASSRPPAKARCRTWSSSPT